MLHTGTPVASVLLIGWALLAGECVAAVTQPRVNISCSDVDACGPACEKCPEVPFGTPTCEADGAGDFTCGVKCNDNFVPSGTYGKVTCIPRFKTGLRMSDEDKVESPLNCTRRNPKCTRKIGDIVGNLKAPLSIEALAKEACSGSEIGQLDCIEGLLLSLIPSKYNSNDAADTPGGKHLVRPAQDQLSCSTCAAFVATAAAEAAVASYMQWNWDKINLSEQDLSFCRLSPRVGCQSGTSYLSIVENVAGQKISSWASRRCYKYTGVPANGECEVIDKRCPSVLPRNATLSMAADGNPLETQAQVKRQIMLNGGVMVSVDIPPEFFSYPNSSRSVSGGPRSTIYTDPPNLQQDQPGVGHALFCFGWSDLPSTTGSPAMPSIDGFWLCKNSWGPRWGLNGRVRIAYGAAGIIDRHPAYGLQFRPSRYVMLANITAMLEQGLSYDKQGSNCLLFTPQQPMRLVKLIDDLFSLSLAAFEAGRAAEWLNEAVILGDIVAANLALPSLSAASTGPFKICGQTSERVAALVPLPPRPMFCSDVPNSAPAADDGCACTREPYTIPAMRGSELRECLSTQDVAESCPSKYPTAVMQAGAIKRCITDTTACPDNHMPFYGGTPIGRQMCQPEQSSCAVPGYTVTLADVRFEYSKKAVIPRALPGATPGGQYPTPGGQVSSKDRQCLGSIYQPCRRSPKERLMSGRTGTGGSFLTGIDYLDEVLGCVSDTARHCPVGYVGFMSAAQDFKLELCTKTDTCYKETPDFTVEPSKYGTYNVPAIAENEGLVACLELDSGTLCPPQYPKRVSINNSTACST